MPKDSRSKSSYFARSKSSPYPCSSNNADNYKSKKSLTPVEHEKEWEEARCPVCMEHPHNAVLLLCSSQDKGCRPYMCDTSPCQSNCLDQYCKSSPTAAPAYLPNASHHGEIREPKLEPNIFHGRRKINVTCPLCRGQISGWVVIESARQFMNSKQRSCSLETCDFSGNYLELRKHARIEHPHVRPSDVDPMRQRDWAIMEQQEDFQDFLSAYRPEGPEDVWNEEFTLEGIEETIDDDFLIWSEFDTSEDSDQSEPDQGRRVSDPDLRFLPEILDPLDDECSDDMSSLMDLEPFLPVTFLPHHVDLLEVETSEVIVRSISRRQRSSRYSYHTQNVPAPRLGNNRNTSLFGNNPNTSLSGNNRNTSGFGVSTRNIPGLRGSRNTSGLQDQRRPHR